MTMAEIVELVSWQHRIPVAVLRRGRGRGKDGAIAKARREAMWRMRQETTPDGRRRYSLTRVAVFMGVTDHTTVRDAVIKHEAERRHRRIAA